MLTLYHLDRSPYGWKTRIVLAEKKVPHRAVVPENKAEDPEFARLNPFRLTPVLVLEDGRAVWESTVVNEYLEEAFPEPAMLPREPWERARIRMIEDAVDQYLFGALREFRGAQYEYAPPYLIPKKPDALDRKAAEAGRAKILDHLALLDRELEGREWIGGPMFSLADAALAAPLLGSLPLLGVLPDPRFPNVARWSAAAAARPSVRDAAPRQPLTIRR